MTARHVVVVDPYSSGALLAAPLRRRGFEPIAVTSFPSAPPQFLATFRPQDFTAVLSAEAGIEALIEELAAFAPEAVVNGAESGVLLGDLLAHELTPDRANSFPLRAARRHKGLMAQALADAGLPTMRSLTCSRAADVAPWVAAQGLAGAELVVKPSSSGGTDGVTLVPAGGDASDAVRRLLGTQDFYGRLITEVVVQERLLGTEYVVDSCNVGGRHSVTNVCRYGKLSDGDRFAVYQSLEFVPFEAEPVAELVEFTGRALDALGVRFGLAHAEVMLTADGPRIIEVGARVPGAGLPGTCTVATGENGIDRLVRYLDDGTLPTPGYTLERAVTVAHFNLDRAGIIGNVQAYEQIGRLPTCRHLKVAVADGDRVEPTTDLDSVMNVGFALLAHRDPAEVERDYRAMRELEALVEIRAEV